MQKAEEKSIPKETTSENIHEPKQLELTDQKEVNNPSTDEQKPVLTVDPETEKMWQRLNEQANNKSRTRFEKMVVVEEWDEKGKHYEFHPIKRSEQAELMKLLTEAAALDKQDDFMTYSENIKKRACLVIEGMTAEQFEEERYELMEDLTVAWSLKIRGF